jgi:uncharacterized protein with HEPN domain
MPSEFEATRRWLDDIQRHIAMAEGFVAGMSYDAFKGDDLRLYAVTRCLEIISEASRRFAGRAESPAPVNRMARDGSSRKHLSARIPSIAARRVWRTLTHDLRLLRDVIAHELAALGGAA